VAAGVKELWIIAGNRCHPQNRQLEATAINSRIFHATV